jgi:hypothetical protein
MNTWPFPNKQSPLVPMTAKQRKEDERQQRERVPDAPF